MNKENLTAGGAGKGGVGGGGQGGARTRRPKDALLHHAPGHSNKPLSGALGTCVPQIDSSATKKTVKSEYATDKTVKETLWP